MVSHIFLLLCKSFAWIFMILPWFSLKFNVFQWFLTHFNDFHWFFMNFNDFQWFLCVFNTFSLILRLLDTFPARSPQTKITSVPCRIFGPWEVLAKIKKDSTVSIRIRGDFWQHGQAQNSPMPGPNKPKQREWVQQKPKLWSYLTPRTLPPTYALTGAQ